MIFYCNRCGKRVSTEVPDKTVIGAWIECTECMLNEAPPEWQAEIKRLRELLTKVRDAGQQYDMPDGSVGVMIPREVWMEVAAKARREA